MEDKLVTLAILTYTKAQILNTPIYASSLPYGDVFNYQIGDEESVKTIIQKVHSDGYS